MLHTCAMRDIALVYSVSRIGWWPVIHAPCTVHRFAVLPVGF
jgi:hypothetical protein